ncbi:hypothetical protein C8J56DRAFT_1031060 [Mycena floridula]|nr:hypothetical protein C8J56DRAFT_1031060 [Mycena floridula]
MPASQLDGQSLKGHLNPYDQEDRDALRRAGDLAQHSPERTGRRECPRQKRPLRYLDMFDDLQILNFNGFFISTHAVASSSLLVRSSSEENICWIRRIQALRIQTTHLNVPDGDSEHWEAVGRLIDATTNTLTTLRLEFGFRIGKTVHPEQSVVGPDFPFPRYRKHPLETLCQKLAPMPCLQTVTLEMQAIHETTFLQVVITSLQWITTDFIPRAIPAFDKLVVECGLLDVPVASRPSYEQTIRTDTALVNLGERLETSWEKLMGV